ncbi:nitrogenase iron-molybdenum cofactor biosynthesis protein NifN [Planktothrix sp. FACHB-1365]|uniref:nitrogenase iron-molybdenum cofactor biosynthesis protein NifN n=1 Tax=Planktothrix sp. FACHB-1365 TaxID=2692855 RepID=UPI001686B978|nr:nitrogenase iron-molybdenum cofactor biosynthesis protein NifN [Planktothrix sp. FACHB-1365]MBD2484714.1 nitrogenase iron-molybdenum cofactor biosynthesis protein NifN [Planktothrix sp. FACHB-1365]
MATVISPKKPVAVNPLKQSQPLGAALAFLGLKGTMPLLHGSQGCTAFAKVLLVRHFREAIPLSTTAMTEVSTILGGEENVEIAILTLLEKAKPDIIGLCTTGLTETRGDDMQGILRTVKQEHPELKDFPIVFVSTPDFKGALQDGYAATVESIIREIPVAGETQKNQVTLLVSSAFTPGDVEEIKEIVTAFGFDAIAVPDLSTSLEGHLSDGGYTATTTGGTTLTNLKRIGSSNFTLALGESMRGAAEILHQRFGTEYQVFPRLTGLKAVDEFLMKLSQLSSSPVPEKYCRQRRQLQDAMLDTHFYFGRKRVCLALEPDLLYSTSLFLQEMGAEIQAAITTTQSPLLDKIPVESVIIGDLEDLENLAIASDLLISNSNAKGVSEKLHIPLYRLGIPIFDRLGNGYFSTVGYRGSKEFLFNLGNLLLEQEENSHHSLGFDPP